MKSRKSCLLTKINSASTTHLKSGAHVHLRAANFPRVKCALLTVNDNHILIYISPLTNFCIFDKQIFQPWIQRRKLEYSRLKHVMSGLLKHAQMHTFGRLIDDDGRPNVSVIEKYATGLQFAFSLFFVQENSSK
jgi:hypothetical protein